MDELQHECGIAAIYHLNGPTQSPLLQSMSPHQVSRLVPRMLLEAVLTGALSPLVLAGLRRVDGVFHREEPGLLR